MVKKIKRFILFVLFSMVFQLIHVKISDGTNERQKYSPQLGIPTAEAGRCCPPGSSTSLKSNGECCLRGESCY